MSQQAKALSEIINHFLNKNIVKPLLLIDIILAILTPFECKLSTKLFIMMSHIYSTYFFKYVK